MPLTAPTRWRWWRRLLSPQWIALLWVLLAPILAVAAAEKTAADYFVESLPGAPEGPLLKMHAGHIEVDHEHNGHLFFWLFHNRHIANRHRLVIWLNGGPGCSSMDGALMEVGPYRLKDDKTLRYNDGSWDEFANLLFVDQPVGTGFSYANTNSYLHELQEMADSFIVFLEKFFKVFPEFESDDIYMAGESYAGQHIPYIARAILERNKKKDVKHKWDLKGLLLGNAWISPMEQYKSYLPISYETRLVKKDSAIAKQLEMQQAVCDSVLAKPGGADHPTIDACEKVLSEMLKLTRWQGDDGGAKCHNMYDARAVDSYPSCGMNWPPDLRHVTPYLRRPDVIRALHVNADKKTGWTECAGGVGSAFRAVKSKPSVHFLPELLAHMPIVLFSGDQDLICNHLGTEELIHKLAWAGGTGFELSPGTWAPRRAWTFEGAPAGLYQSARNLTYVRFYNASHMVPFDWPRRSRDMLDRFLRVDIASIGGRPADSRLDGEERGPDVSVGAHPNSTAARARERARLKQAQWDAYYRSGAVALVVVAAAAALWGWWVWRERRRRGAAEREPYYGLLSPRPPATDGGLDGAPAHAAQRHHHHQRRRRLHRPEQHRRLAPGSLTTAGLERFRRKKRGGGGDGDVEAGDFDESELDNLHVPSPGGADDLYESDEDGHEGGGDGGGGGGGRGGSRDGNALGLRRLDGDIGDEQQQQSGRLGGVGGGGDGGGGGVGNAKR